LSRYSNGLFAYRSYPLAELNQDPPTVDTWYPVLDGQIDCRLVFCAVRQINDEAAAKNLEVRWVLDGETFSAAFSADNDTWYYVYRVATSNALAETASVVATGYYAARHAQLADVDVRITSAVGTNQELDGRVDYEVLMAT